MRKAIFAMSTAMFSLIAISIPVRAEVITYRCIEPDDPAPMIFRIDTKTHSAQETEQGQISKGVAQIDSQMIVFTATDGRAWTIRINRKTGESIDSDGTAGSCQPTK
jgi:hypothetical protein